MSHSVVLLSGQDLRQLLQPRVAIDAIRAAAYAALVDNRGDQGRSQAFTMEGGSIHVKSGLLPGSRSAFASKVNINFPNNWTQHRLPTIQGLVVVADARNGRPLAVMESMTLVSTHIPSSICLILTAVVANLELTLALLLVRAALSQMDVPTRSSYVMAVVTPPERSAAASVTVVPRSLAAAISPAIAGALFAAGFEAWPLIICGVLKILYDLALLQSFRHLKPPEEQLTPRA